MTPNLLQTKLGSRNRRNAFLWLLALLGLVAFTAIKLSGPSPFYSDITDLLPNSHQQPEVIALEKQINKQFSKQLLLLLRTDDEAHSLQLAQQLDQQLQESDFVTQSELRSDLQQQFLQIFQPYGNQLLSTQMRDKLQQSSPSGLAEEAAQSLFNPAATPRPTAFNLDPFNLSGQWLQSSQTSSRVVLRNGWPVITAARGSWYLVNLEIAGSPFDLTTQADILPIIERFEQQVIEDGVDFQLLKSGILFHASAGADLAKSEISTVGIGSLLAIITLVLVIFRSSTPLLGVLIALSCGLLSALAASLLIFDRIHLLTLAFGSTLLGVAVDYCFHFMLNSQQLGCSQRCRKLLGPALATSALSSIAAYLLQLTTPFPGLQQIAVFSAAGLAGTWLTVIALGPFYRPMQSPAVSLCRTFFQRHVLPLYQRYRAHHRLYMGFTCGLFLLAGYILQTQPGNNDIRSLNTSGDALIAETKQVEQLLQPSSSNRFYIASAASEQQLLEQLEALQQGLQPLHQRQFINAEQSLAHWTPSQQQQRADYELINTKLYQQALPLLCKLLTITDCSALQVSAQREFNPGLTSSNIRDSQTLEALQPVVIGQGLHAAMLITLNPLATDEDLREVSKGINGVQFVNRVDNLSDLLVTYRQAVAAYLGLAFALIATVLLYRYKLCGLRILIPMSLSALLGLAVAANCCGITVFHLLAVLLVVGIALDTGIFYREMGLNGESWLAATLSSATSVLAFGLLSLSQVPILHQFGVVVLTGILCSWLLTPLFFAREEDCANLAADNSALKSSTEYES